MLEKKLRSGRIPVIGRISDGALYLDLRSVEETMDAEIISAVTAAFA
jgi:seryl-tRNA(Sec) selenium transferase